MITIYPPVIAHRGASCWAPENTLAALRKAAELGAKWVEFDVMATSDKEIVVIHDETLERTTTGKGFVDECTYPYLCTLDAGSWFNPQFATEKVPTLREVIALLNELKLCANIEIKSQLGKEDPIVKSVLTIVQECWQHDHPPLISSFSPAILHLVREYSSTAMIGFLMHEWIADWQQQCEQLHAATVNVNHKILTQQRAQQIKATNRPLFVYTVNDPAQAEKLFSWGVDAVFSDCPEKMIKVFFK